MTNLGLVLTPLPVLIPMVAGALTLLAGRRAGLQRAITQVALLAVVVVCGALLYLTDRDGTILDDTTRGELHDRDLSQLAIGHSIPAA